MNASTTSSKLREMADTIDAAFKEGSVITFRSQNMTYSPIGEYIVEKADGEAHNVSCRGQRLSTDVVTIHGQWISRRRGRGGVFRTPDERLWLVVGDAGDPWSAAWMSFREITDDPQSAEILQESIN